MNPSIHCAEELIYCDQPNGKPCSGVPSMNFWLNEEQPVARYLSGMSNKLRLCAPPQCIQALNAEKPKVLLCDNMGWFKVKRRETNNLEIFTYKLLWGHGLEV